MESWSRRKLYRYVRGKLRRTAETKGGLVIVCHAKTIDKAIGMLKEE